MHRQMMSMQSLQGLFHLVIHALNVVLCALDGLVYVVHHRVLPRHLQLDALCHLAHLHHHFADLLDDLVLLATALLGQSRDSCSNWGQSRRQCCRRKCWRAGCC